MNGFDDLLWHHWPRQCHHLNFHQLVEKGFSISWNHGPCPPSGLEASTRGEQWDAVPPSSESLDSKKSSRQVVELLS